MATAVVFDVGETLLDDSRELRYLGGLGRRLPPYLLDRVGSGHRRQPRQRRKLRAVAIDLRSR
jgi:hypothetical protein